MGSLISNHDKMEENGPNLSKTKNLELSTSEKCVRIERFIDYRGGPIN